MNIEDIGNSELALRQTGHTRLQEICSRFELDYAFYGHVDKQSNAIHGCTTFSVEWVRHYVDNNLVLVDPLIQLGVASIAPIDWAVLDDRLEQKTLFDTARRFGVAQNGLSIPIISPFGDRGIFTVTSNLPRSDWDSLVAKTLPALRHEAQVLHLLALDVIDTVFNFSRDSLSSDELDVLKMLASGNKLSVIVSQTGYSSRTVDALTASITNKLKCRTIEQAIARAVRANILN